MVTSVNGSSLAAVLAQEQAVANRTPPAEQPTDPTASPAVQTDPAVVYAGSDGGPSAGAILAVSDSLNRAASISDVGLSAGNAIAGLLSVLREKAQSAQIGSGDPQALNQDYQDALATIDQLAKSASFQGVKMLDGNPGQDLSFKADLAGETQISLATQDFTAAGPVLGLAGTDLLGGPSDLASVLDRIDAASSGVADQLGQMSAQSDQIQAHLGVLGQLQTGLEGGAGASPDAEAARLQALTIQQALAAQNASVANQAPQALLSLFRN